MKSSIHSLRRCAALLLAVLASLLAPEAHAQLPAAVTNQPILFVVRNQYQTDHHNTHTMFPSAANELNNGFYEGGNSALRIFDPATGSVTTLLDAGASGVVRDPDVHFSGKRVVFAWRKSQAGHYNIYEINTDGTGLQQLTAHPDVDDFDPVYMADDRIIFVSGREPKYVMCNRHLSHNLYRMDADGANITQIAKSTLFEGHPSLMADGRILYDRWEYVDRNFGDAQGLWTCEPEGTGHTIYYGNNTSSPGGVLDGREIPGTHQAVCTFVACHDKPWGAIAVIDRRRAIDGLDAVVHRWPAFSDSWVKVNDYVNSEFDIFASTSPKYEDPYPLVDPDTGVGGRYFLCSKNIGPGEHMAISLLDAQDGSSVVIHDEGSGDVGCFSPMPLAPITRPDDVSVHRKYDETPGRFYVVDVYKGTHMEGVERGTVKYLRVVESPEKRFYTMQGWAGQGTEAPGVNWDSFETKRILGTVPVEEDGSAYFEVPPYTFVFFQLLDENGMMIHSMRSGTVVQPNETQGCVGCHDNRIYAPHAPSAAMPAAFTRPADTLDGWQGEPPKMFNYLSDVQPVFDAKCMSCHDYGGPGTVKVTLAGDKGLCFNASYAELWRKGYTGAIGAGQAAIQPAKAWGSHASRLVEILQSTHTNRVTLTAEEFDRIVTWIDQNAVYYPSYASNYPNNAGGRSPLSPAQLSQLAAYTGANVGSAAAVKASGELVSFDRPEMSPCLSGVTGNNYTSALAIIQAGQANLSALPREDMTNCVLNSSIDIWRENKYQKSLQREQMNRAAVIAGEKVYDAQPLIGVANSAPEGISENSAEINGNLFYTVSNTTANIYVAWGMWAAGDTTNGWQSVVPLGSLNPGEDISLVLNGLSAGRPVYYRIFAVNAEGVSSAHETGVFNTLTLLGQTPSAQTLTWSSTTTGPVEDGAGSWVTAADNWVDTNGVHQFWSNHTGDSAAFGAGGIAGTVAVHEAGMTVGGVVFNAVSSGAYLFSGGPLTLTNAPVFAVHAPASVASKLTGADGFVKTGAATLTLSGANSYKGTTQINEGVLKLSSITDLSDPSVLSDALLSTLVLHLDASDASSLATNADGSGVVTNSGDAVGYWGDLSDSDLPAVQGDGTRRPQYVESVAEFNGLPVLQFDGSNDKILSDLNISASSIPDMTVVMVYRKVTSSVNGGLWGHDNGNWDRLQLLDFGAVGNDNIAGNNNSIKVNGMNNSDVLLYTATLRDGVVDGSRVYINGVSDGTAGLTFTSQENTVGESTLTIGCIGNNKSIYYGNIQIGEVLVFDTALSDADRINVEAYLNNKWLNISAPAQLPVTSGLALRLDASETSTLAANADGSGAVASDNDPVGYWGDLSDSSLSATQSIAINRPVYVESADEFNGLPVIEFDGVNDDITSLLDINPSNLPDMTIMIVYRQVAKTANGGLWGHDNSGWDRLQLLNFSNGGQYDGYPIATAGFNDGRTPVNGMNTTNTVLIYTASLRNGVANGSYVYINGVSDSSSGLPAFTSTDSGGFALFTLANISPANGYYGYIRVGEVLVYDSILSETDRIAVESYLHDKWVEGYASTTAPMHAILPVDGSVEIADDAALDLGGITQRVDRVSGSGVVSNGVLAVTDMIEPGGINAVGTLTIPGAPLLDGATLSIDLAGGTSDRLVCSGDLALDGVVLELTNPAVLVGRSGRYAVAVCSGNLTGSLIEPELPEGWQVLYSRTPGAGAVSLFKLSSGTLFIVK